MKVSICLSNINILYIEDIDICSYKYDKNYLKNHSSSVIKSFSEDES